MATHIGDLRTGGLDTQNCRILHHVTRPMLSYPMATGRMYCQPDQRVDSRYEDVIKTMRVTMFVIHLSFRCFAFLRLYITIMQRLGISRVNGQ